MSDYRQFKLVSGEEIVCEVVEWNNPDEDDGVIIRYPLIIKYEPLAVGEDGIPSANRAAILIPWFLHQMQLGAVQTMNLGHCTAEAIPTESVMDYYHATVSAMVVDLEEEIDNDDGQENYDQYLDEMEEDSTNVVDMFKGKVKPTTIH